MYSVYTVCLVYGEQSLLVSLQHHILMKQQDYYIVYAFVISYVLAKVLDKAMGGIRVEDEAEVVGLDTKLHEESAYNFN